MAVKKYKPTTPGTRGMTGYSFEEITKSTPERSLLVPLRKSGGRNAYGRVTVRHRGGGHRRFIRLVDFKRDKRDILAKVAAIEYDPNRTARLALLHYADGEKRYIVAPLDLKVGDTVGPAREPISARVMRFRSSIPVGTLIHNIEVTSGRGAAGPLCGWGRPAPGKGRRFCPGPHAIRRSSPDSPDLLCDHRSGRQPITAMSSSARPGATATRASARPFVALRCRRAIIPMVVVKVASRSVCRVQRAHGASRPWGTRPARTRRPTSILCAVAVRRTAKV